MGVAPGSFESHSPRQHGQSYDIGLPLRVGFQDRGRQWLLCVARLRPGVSVEGAEAELKQIGLQLAAEYPDANQSRPFRLRSHYDEITRQTRSVMWFLFAAVALLLLIACDKVASMLLAKGAQRQEEFSLRFALGASSDSSLAINCGLGVVRPTCSAHVRMLWVRTSVPIVTVRLRQLARCRSHFAVMRRSGTDGTHVTDETARKRSDWGECPKRVRVGQGKRAAASPGGANRGHSLRRPPFVVRGGE